MGVHSNGTFNTSITQDVAAAFFVTDMALAEETESEQVAEYEVASAEIDLAAFDRFVRQYKLNDHPGVVIVVSRDEYNVHVETPGGDKRPVSLPSPIRLSLGPDRSIEFGVDDDDVAASPTIKGQDNLVAMKLEE